MINEHELKRKCKGDYHLIENYDKALNDNSQTWECHHRLELTLDGEFAHTSKELERLDMYWDRPYFELIFLTNSEHKKLHSKGENNPRYNKPISEFGIKFKEHYKIPQIADKKLYDKEKHWFKRHGKCRWE